MTDKSRALLGRNEELRELEAVLADVAMQRGRVVLLTGEAGVGKTCLVEEMARLAAAEGFVVGWGRCSPTDMPPSWPWIQVLRSLLGTAEVLESRQFRSAVEQWAAVAEALESRARLVPLLLILEDVHWADDGSRRLLEFVAASVAGQRIGLVATSREEGHDLPVGGQVRRLELAGLDVVDIAGLVERITGEEPTPTYANELQRRTGGNPFFVGEVARLQASRGVTRGPVPTAVRQVLQHRLARLPQETVALLEVASVVGSPQASVLAVLTGLPNARVRTLLEPAVQAEVIGPDGFAHDLMRETVYTGLAAPRRARLHRRVAEHLQAGGPAELARHWSLADGQDARFRAAELYVTAGDFAIEGFAYEQAVSHYRRAVELGASDRSVPRRLGEAMVLSGRIADGREILHGVASRAWRASDADELARAVLALGGGFGGFEVDVFDPEQAALIEDAVSLLPPGDTSLRAALLARRSLTMTTSASTDERSAIAQEAVAVAARVGDAAAEVAALAALCDARSGPDHLAERVAAADRMLELAHGQALLDLLARRMRIRARLEQGDFTGARSDLAAYAAVAARLRSPTYAWPVPMWRGMLAELDGDLEVADRYATETEGLAEQAQSDNGTMMAWSLQWRVARRRGDVDTLRAMVEPISERSDNYPGWACTFALLYAEIGRPELGRTQLRKVMTAGLDSLPKDSEWVELLWSLGEAAILLDERGAAQAVAHQLAPYADLWAVDGWGSACFGQVSELLTRIGHYLGSDPGGRVPTPEHAAFVRSGTLWQVTYGGRDASLIDSKGLRDLAVLLAAPRREVAAVDLVEVGGGPARGDLGGDTGPVLDAPARAAYKRRLIELEDEIDAATLDHDEGRLEKLQSERDFLIVELGSALGLGGRVRVAGDPAERARKAVTMRIRSALKAVDAVHPELARHLRNSVTTGRMCCYRPERDVAWQLT